MEFTVVAKENEHILIKGHPLKWNFLHIFLPHRFKLLLGLL